MQENSWLSVGRAFYVYLAALVLLLLGSITANWLLGFAWSLWVNQGVFLAIAAFLAWRNKWSWRDVYRFRATDWKTGGLSLLIGFGLWWGGLAFNIWSARLVDQVFGLMPELDLGLAGLDPLVMIVALVVLAPICEEILFRGYFMRAFAASSSHPWIWAGLLFGILHVGNGLASAVPATLFGFALGYIVWRSNSIWPGILAHAGININAVMLGWLMQEYIDAPRFELSLVVISAAALAVLGILLWLFVRHTSPPMAQERARFRPRPAQWVALLLAVLVLLGLAGLEISQRIPGLQRGQVSFSAASFSGTSQFGEIEIYQPPRTMELLYRLESRVITARLMLLAPDGSVAWDQELDAMDVTMERAVPVEIVLDMAGTWLLVLEGSGQDTRFEANWEIR